MATYLNDLPHEHPDRNRPLVGCWYRWKHAKNWMEIKQSFGIALFSFNQLGPTWTDNDIFCAELPE